MLIVDVVGVVRGFRGLKWKRLLWLSSGDVCAGRGGIDAADGWVRKAVKGEIVLW